MDIKGVWKVVVDELIAEFTRHLQLGKRIKCPVCGRDAGHHTRPYNATMAHSLIWLADEWIDVGSPAGGIQVGQRAPAWLLSPRELTANRFWGLIERPTVDPNDALDTSEKKRRKPEAGWGFWLPTKAGLAFIRGECRIQENATSYRRDLVRLSGKEISIDDALVRGNFDYSTVISATRNFRPNP